MSITEVANCLREYGSALRGSWGGIDGRAEQGALNELADAIESPASYSIEQMRDILGVCPLGDGHWTEFCDQECGKE